MGWTCSKLHARLFLLNVVLFLLTPESADGFHKLRKLKKLAKYGLIGAALMPRYIPIAVRVDHNFGAGYDIGHGGFQFVGAHGIGMHGGFEDNLGLGTLASYPWW